MPTVTEIRKSVTEATPVLAMVGVTDLAVERVRSLAARAEHAAANLDAKSLQEQAAQVPTLAVNRALVVANEVVVQFESQYETLAARGRAVVDRVQSQKATKDLLTQGKATLSRTKAAVTTARKVVAQVAGGSAATVAGPASERPVAERPVAKRAATKRAATKRPVTKADTGK